MAEIFEIVMLLCFGASWPISLVKNIKAKSTAGKCPIFLILIMAGYVSGVVAKFLNESYMANIDKKWYVLFFYCLNFCMVGADLIVYYRNKKLESINKAQ